MTASITPSMRDRAHGVLLGQFVGDALGATVEFSDPATIIQRFPNGLREIVGEGPFQLLPGQVTDDSELALARTLVAHGWELDARANAYTAWLARCEVKSERASTQSLRGFGRGCVYDRDACRVMHSTRDERLSRNM